MPSIKNYSVHQHETHGENAMPFLRANSMAFIHTSPGVDNQANYAHSPPKGCCTATAKLVGV